MRNLIITPYLLIFLCCLLNFSEIIAQTSDNLQPDSVKNTRYATDSTNKLQDSLTVKQDSLQTDSLQNDSTQTQKTASQPKGAIKTTINYKAEDSITLNVPDQTAKLYDKAEVDYSNRKITANHIDINWKTNIVSATYTKDSSDNKTGIPVFEEDNDTYKAEKIKYNYSTRRGIVRNIITQESEGYVKGEKVKINEEKEVFVDKGIYTDCDCDNPCYTVKAHKIKLIPDKKVVTGPFYMELESIPTPLAFLFGYFPLPKQRSSGIRTPDVGESARRGFFLRNGGYYWAVNDYLGIDFLGEIYSIGSYGLTVNADYKKRYAYNGLLEFDYMRNIINADDINQYASSDIWLRWNHRPVSRRSSSFRASVNAGTSTYNQNNEYTPQTQQGQFNSSIQYRKNFVNTPFRLNIAARQEQNVSNKRMNFDLPNMQLSMNRVYPFKNLFSSNNNWTEPFHNFNVNYAFSGKNEITNIVSPYPDKNYNIEGVPSGQNRHDTLTVSNSGGVGNFLQDFANESNMGASHSIQANTSIKLLKYFSLNPNISYTQNWYQYNYQYRDWSPATQAVQIDTSRRLNLTHAYNMGASMNTSLYGTFFVKKLGIEAIRHTLRPTVRFTYNPSFEKQAYQRVRVDSGRYIHENRFGPVLYPLPGSGSSKRLNFSLDNVLEMKVKNNKDTTQKFKKVSLFDNFNLNANYDLEADSFNLSTINIVARTSLFNNKFTLGINGNVNPYYYQPDEETNEGIMRPVYAWKKGQGPGHLESMRLTMNTTLNPQAWKGSNEDENKTSLNKQYGYMPFNLPWNLRIGYTMNYDKTGLGKSFYNHNITLNGRISPSKKWNVSFNTGYDWQDEQFSITRINITRDLNCWNFSFNIVPFGRYKSYNLTIRAKASMLSDILKVEKNRSWRDF